MKTSSTDIQRERDMAMIDVWENEGGAPGRNPAGHQYGRRIEADRSWTVYHVFTGIPASVDGNAMMGLSRSDATNSMISLNIRNARPVLPTSCRNILLEPEAGRL